MSQYVKMMGIIVVMRERYRKNLRFQENQFAHSVVYSVAGSRVIDKESSTLMRDSLVRVQVTLLARPKGG